MKEFGYTIRSPLGLHARVIGALVTKAREYHCQVTIEKQGDRASLEKPLQMMRLNIRQGDEVNVQVEGEEEELACMELERFFKERI